jgi:type VI protein secretion system component Hcp
MKKFILSLLMAWAVMGVHAQVTVYARFTLYNGGVLVNENNSVVHTGQIQLTSYSGGDEQTLNIGSQSSGAGAGKVVFDPVIFSKPVSVNSPQFSSMLASGTPFQKVEIYFYNGADKLIFMQTLGLVAFKSIQRSVAPCTTPACPGLVETISMEYGTEVNTFYPVDAKGLPGKPLSYGWNRVKNVKNDDPAVLQ